MDEILQHDLRRRARAIMFWTAWTVLWLAPTAAFLLLAVAHWIGLDADIGSSGIVIMLFTGSVAGLGVARLVHHYREPPRFEPTLTPRPRPYRLPRPGSSARAPMRRLTKSEAHVTELLNRLDDPRIPPEWITNTKLAVANTSANLRSIASKIESAERTLDRTRTRWEREILGENLLELLSQLNRGLAGYDKLIEAASDVTLASTTTLSMDELTNATDHLTGLAQALRELRSP